MIPNRRIIGCSYVLAIFGLFTLHGAIPGLAVQVLPALPGPGDGGGVPTAPAAPAQAPVLGVVPGDYELGPGDIVQIQVPFEQQINGVFTVDRSGFVTMPLLGRVRAAGRTLPELEADVTGKAAEFVRDPQAIVSLVQKRVMQVTVTGSVVRPSIYQVDGVTTLLEVLAAAGGPGPDAGPTIRISRQPEEGPIIHPEARADELGRSIVDLSKDDVMNLRGSTNLVLKPGDIVSVEMAQMVYVMAGGVQGRIPLENDGQISVANALIRAGVQPGSKAKDSTILRQIARADAGESVARIDEVNVEKIFKGEIPDVLLYPDDLLYVPPDEGPGLARGVLDQGISGAINFLTWGIL